MEKKPQQSLEDYIAHCLPTVIENTVTVYVQKRTCEYIGNVAAQMFVHLHAHEQHPREKYINRFLDLYSTYRENGIDDTIAEFKSLKHTQVQMLTDFYHAECKALKQKK